MLSIPPSRISTHAPLAGRDISNGTLSCALMISTHAPLAGRDQKIADLLGLFYISTHAPLAGRDTVRRGRTPPRQYFNPRAPCGARLSSWTIINSFGIDFNPRAPCGARPSFTTCWSVQENFNPRAPCGARRDSLGSVSLTGYISTHAPLAGRDPQIITAVINALVFQPTRPLRGATASASPRPVIRFYFNPRAPCGARLVPPRYLARAL